MDDLLEGDASIDVENDAGGPTPSLGAGDKAVARGKAGLPAGDFHGNGLAGDDDFGGAGGRQLFSRVAGFGELDFFKLADFFAQLLSRIAGLEPLSFGRRALHARPGHGKNDEEKPEKPDGDIRQRGEVFEDFHGWVLVARTSTPTPTPTRFCNGE